MLEQLKIHSFAIIDKLTLDFESGMTVITGETGAGKSIILDAITLALGGRLDSKIHASDKRCDIYLSFNINKLPKAKKWLITHELNTTTEECIIRRSISPDGRSKCYINDQIVTIQVLQEFAPLLLMIHGQQQHQQLLKFDEQRNIIDDYAGLTDLVQTLNQTFHAWQHCQIQLTELQATAQQKLQRQEFLQFQLQELHELSLIENEIPDLNAKHKELANFEDTSQKINSLINLLKMQDQSLIDQLHIAHKLLQQIKSDSPSIKNCDAHLQESLNTMTQAYEHLQDYQNHLELDPEHFAKLEKRLALLHDMARKHKIRPEQLFEKQQTINEELSTLANLEHDVSALEQQLQIYHAEYFQLAKDLSSKRLLAAKRLSKAVTENIHQLGMQSGQFEITVTQQTEQLPKLNGLEKIEFMVAMNKGQSLQAMHKVASGGELARISLALEVILAQKMAVPTLIFDEVDVGIGGKTAAIVGRLLKTLSQSAQVMCITHQPQVAALGQQHFVVSKTDVANKTVTSIQSLTPVEKIQEIARMLGGINISEQTLKVAEEMVAAGEE